MPYPHVKLLQPSDAVALVIPSLDKGDLPILCEFEGELRKIGMVRYSATVLADLSKISELELHRTSSDVKRIKCVSDVLEAMIE